MGKKPGKTGTPKPTAATGPKQAVSLSAGNASKVKELLQALPTTSTKPSGPQLNEKQALKQYSQVYDKLLEYGFQRPQIQEVLQALPQDDINAEAALDWLCLNLPSHQLPRGFAAAARFGSSTSQVKVVHRAVAEGGTSAQSAPGADQEDEGPPPWLPPAGSQGAGPGPSKVDDAAEAARRKAWIMQQMGGSSGEDEGSEKSEESEIDEWELWADPREVARRKAERAKAKIPPEVRKQHIIAEWLRVKAAAAAAKLAGDKPRQKECGTLIRELKLEAEQLGITEAVLQKLLAEAEEKQRAVAAAAAAQDEPLDLWGDAPAPKVPPAALTTTATTAAAATTATTATAAAAAGPGPSSSGSAAGNGLTATHERLAQNGGNGGDGGGSTAAGAPEEPGAGWEELFEGAEAGAGAERGPSGREVGTAGQEPSSATSKAPGDDEVPVFDIFELPVEEPKAPARARPPPPQEMVGPWGAYGTGGGGKKKPATRGGKPVPAQELKMPKALLQQHCQKASLTPPRFDKMLAPPGQYSYSVMVAPIATGAKARKGQSGPRTFQLLGELANWDKIEDAQNAVATRALWELLGQQQALHHMLPPTYRDMWLRWENEVEDDQTLAEAEIAEQKLDFVRGLVAAQQREGGPAPDSAADADADEERELFEEAPQPEPVRLVDERQVAADSARLSAAAAAFRGSADGREWARKRGQLPIIALRQDLIAALQRHDVCIVGGETGSGKTTQVPQYLLEDAIDSGRGGACSIVCTQPRRIAAISVAERVAAERGEGAPGSRGCTVGYHVRLDAATSRDTRLLFCTTGILLRRLASDPTLSSVSVVVVDEVHERTMQGDFLIAILRELVLRRHSSLPLKVVLMSATLDSAMFADYFGGCPVLSAQGRTFPVQHVFLEDVYERTRYVLAPDSRAALRSYGGSSSSLSKQAGGSRSTQSLVRAGWGDDEGDSGPLNPHYDAALYGDYSLATRRNLARCNEEVLDVDLAEALVQFICAEHEPGAILVFLPGMGEITALYDRLAGSREHRAGKLRLVPLHSAVAPAEQRSAFVVPPPGVRKVVLATNIAETSLTIEDVVYVVDSGKHKERRYDPVKHMSLLVEDWVSKASATQRRGRAGRVREGLCFALYTRQRFDQRLRRYQVPEIARVPLEELVLQIHVMQLGPAASFLGQVLEPPKPRAVTAAVESLEAVGALTPEEKLTPLGHHLAALPVEPRLGKLLLLGAVLGVLGPALTIAACLSHKSPFAQSLERRDDAGAARSALCAPGSGSIAAGQQSDHLLMVAAYEVWRTARRDGGKGAAAAAARQHQLHTQTLEALAEMRGQFAGVLADIRLVVLPPDAPLRSHGGVEPAWLDDPKAQWNRFAHMPQVVKAVLCAALDPNVVVMAEGSSQQGRPLWVDSKGEEVAIHPSSINHMLTTPQLLAPYLVFLEKMKTSRVFVRDCSVVPATALLLFGGALTVLHHQGSIMVDRWIAIRADAQTAVLVKRLREALDSLLEEKIRRSTPGLSSAHAQVIDAIVALLRDDQPGR